MDFTYSFFLSCITDVTDVEDVEKMVIDTDFIVNYMVSQTMI